MAKGNTKKTGAPEWATLPFENGIESLQKHEDILLISMRGISMLIGMPRLVEALAKLDADENEQIPKEKEAEIEIAVREADLAKSEAENDYPVLFSQATTMLWSNLESLIKTFFVSWLQNNSNILEKEPFNKIKIQLIEFKSMDEEEQNYFILEAIEQKLNAPLKKGVSRFESLLDTLGISGNVEDDVRKKLLELQQVRNVIVHRNGIADRKLLNTCPWLTYELKDPVIITRSEYRMYTNSVQKYLITIMKRLGVYFKKQNK